MNMLEKDFLYCPSLQILFNGRESKKDREHL